MPKTDHLQGTLDLLVLKILSRRGPLHGYAIMTAVEEISGEGLRVEEGSLYPALQKMLLKGWVKAEWGISENNRKVRFYHLTPAGKKQLQAEIEDFGRVVRGIEAVMSKA